MDILDLVGILDDSSFHREVVWVKSDHSQNAVSYFFRDGGNVTVNGNVIFNVFRICFVVIDSIVYLYLMYNANGGIVHLKFDCSSIVSFDL